MLSGAAGYTPGGKGTLNATNSGVVEESKIKSRLRMYQNPVV